MTYPVLFIATLILQEDGLGVSVRFKKQKTKQNPNNLHFVFLMMVVHGGFFFFKGSYFCL